MTDKPISIDELTAAREALIDDIVGNMPNDHRQSLLSFERGAPNWELLGIPAAAELPAVRWRQQNLDKIPAKKREDLIARLEEVLEG